MIAEILIGMFMGFIENIFVLIPTDSVPAGAIEPLAEFFVYGSYIVGPDTLILFGAIVFAWAFAKISIGLGIRLWELLPFT